MADTETTDQTTRVKKDDSTKGDNSRVSDHEEYRNNYDLIFGKQSK